MSYDTLEQLAQRVVIYPGILQTRLNQVAMFAKPQQDMARPGFHIVVREKKKAPTKAEKKLAAGLEMWVENTGSSRSLTRDNFEMYLRKTVRDSMIFDQACHPAGTKIETTNGVFMPIEKVVIGDQVRTHAGRMRPVKELKRRSYTGDLFTIKSGGQVLEATEEHPILAVTDKWFRLTQNRDKGIKPQWVKAKDLTDDCYLVYPRPKVEERDCAFSIFNADNPRLYPNIPYQAIAEMAGVHKQTAAQILCGAYTKNGPAIEKVKEIAAAIGFERRPIWHPAEVQLDEKFAAFCALYVAEGSLMRNTTGQPSAVSFTFDDDEQDLIELVRSVLDDLGVTIGAHDYAKYDRRGQTIFGSSVDLARFMEQNFGAGSQNLYLPDWILSARYEIRQSFAWYYLMGEGCFNKGSISFSTISEKLFGGMRVLLASLGMYVRLSYEPARVVERNDGQMSQHQEKFNGQIGGPIMPVVFPEILKRECGAPTRRQNRYIRDEEFFYIKIHSITRRAVVDLPVYNLEIDEDHSFIANGYASHNCTESVLNRKGIPADFYAIDGASVRLADTAWTDEQNDPDNQVRYVQVHDESVIAEFTPAQLMFGVRNPRTNLRVNGYGYSELEMGIQTVTSLLNAVSYNSKFFSQGSTAKGMLNLPDVPDSKLRIFSRQWHMMLSGVTNSWRTPITNFKEATWIDFHKNNKDMEYGEFLNFLIKIFSSICQIDPTEINFIYGNVGQNSSMFQAPAEEKIVNSKDRGLAPLLNFICENLNRYLIWRINENFKLVFTGLDPREGETTVDLEKKQVTYLKTVNELRAENDLEPLSPEEGDLILDAQWMQAHMNVLQQKQQEEQMKQQQQQGGQQAGDEGQGQPGDEEQGQGDEEQDQEPQDQGAPPQQDQGGDFDESEPPPMQMQKSERKATLKKSNHGHVETIEIDL